MTTRIAMLLALLYAGPAFAQGTAAKTVWDLAVGAHANQMPADLFIDFACGTGGGPPSLQLGGWTEFGKCRPDARTGLHEVYFRYDDELEYVARARNNEAMAAVYQFTSAYDITIIASALFDDDGFFVGYRIVSDPRVDVARRENGAYLGGFLRALYGEEKLTCIDLPRGDGETEFQGIFTKKQCSAADVGNGLSVFLEMRQLRKRGQAAIQAQEGPTTGQFESTTFLEAILAGGIPDRATRLANLVERQPSAVELAAVKARDCAGCDLRGANLKRANLAGAKLAGADLSGANLHGAVLTGADLSGANLTGANINRTDLKRAKLNGANLSNVMLFETRLDAADLTGANLTGALASKVQLIGANLTNATIRQADLSNSRLNDANFHGADLSGAYLNDAQLSRSNLSAAKLVQASLWRVSLIGVDLSQADVRGADLFGANLRGADLSAADFSYARLTNAIMSETKTAGAKFQQAELPAGFAPN